MTFKVAIRWRLVRTNPVAAVDRPRVDPVEMNVLSEAEISRLIAAYGELEREAEPEERPWWRIARRITLVALGTACRRGELLGFAWKDVRLLESLVSVRQTVVGGA